MNKYRIKIITTKRGDGSSKTTYHPQHLFKILWIFPVWFMMDDGHNSEEYAQRKILEELRKKIHEKEVTFVEFNEKKTRY